MPLDFVMILRRCIVFSAVIFSNSLYAAAKTTAYLALNSQPLYANQAFMPYANPYAPKGGQLIQAAQGTFDNLNSMNGKGNATEGVGYLFDTLMSPSLDETQVLYPLLANSVTFDPSHPKSILFNLNPKARFSNGWPLTAEDVKFSFDSYQHKANLGLQMYLSGLESTQVLSPHQIQFNFSSANSNLAYIVASLPIYSKKDWQNQDFKQISLRAILGSGPYVIHQIRPGRQIIYKRNLNYWGKDLAVNRGRYNFEQLQYIYFRSEDVAFEAFKAGQYSWREEKNAAQWASGYPLKLKHPVRTLAYRSANPMPIRSIVINTRRAPFDDLVLRQAMSDAYDFKWQNKAFFYGQFERLQSYFNQSELAGIGAPSAKELKILKPLLSSMHPFIRNKVLTNWSYPEADDSGFNRSNLIQASRSLKQAGYTLNAQQLIDPKGRPVRAELLYQDSDLQRVLLPWTQNLKRLGIQVRLHKADVPELNERLRRYDFDLTTLDLPQSLSPGQEQAQFWGSKAARELGNYNYSGVREASVDQLLERLAKASRREDIVTTTRALDRVLRAGYYQVLTYGKPENWYVYRASYRHPKRLPRLNVGLDYWWQQPQAVSHHPALTANKP